MLKRLWSNIDLIVVVPHELAHFIAGRVLGVGVILGLTSVAVPKDISVWKHVVILIAPTIVGILALAGFVSVPFLYGLTRSTLQTAIWGGAFGIALLATCIGDWRDLIRFYKTGRIL